MSTYDANWPRWIQASVREHFKTAADAISIPFIMDGIDERTTGLQLREDNVRLHVPFSREVQVVHVYWNVATYS